MADELEPEHGPLRDGSVVWRLSIWGGAATVAVACAVLITQSDLGIDRMVQALSQPATEKVAAAPDELVKRAEAQRIEETRRLEARIRDLINDRDKLNSRLATLEQNFGDLTGSIKRDIAAIQATAPKPLTTPAPAPVLSAPPTTTAPAAAPAEAKAEPKPEPKMEAKVDAKIEAKPEPKSEPKSEPKADAKVEAPRAPVTEAPAQPQIVNVPMPVAAPTRVASAPQTLPDERKSEIGVELGGARSVEILNARWAAVKANFGPLIEGLSPLMRHDEKPGVTIPYRLIVGPLPSRAAAAQLCNRFSASKVSCRTTDFAGDKLAP